MDRVDVVDNIEVSYGDYVTTEGPNSTESVFYFYQDEQLTFLYILFSLIVLGNTLVVIVICATKSRKSRMHIFILNLAIADLSAGLINVLTDIVWKNTIDWYAGNVGCKVVRYGQGVVTYASTYALVALSLDRLNAIARPLSFSGDRLRIRILIGLAWSLALVFSIPMLIINRLMLVNGKWQCWIEFPQQWVWRLYMTSICIVLFFIPAIVIAVCYIIIVVIIWRKTSLSAASEKPSQYVKTGGQLYVAANNSRFRDGSASSRGVIPRAKMKTIKMTLVIVLVFIVCWSPYFIFDLLSVYGYVPNTQDSAALSTFIQSLAPLNSAANPIIYASFNTKMCVDLFRCKVNSRYNSSPVNTTNYTSYSSKAPRRHLCD
ncbi:cardioacceleratory peptide receptor-like [Biomphalaria glabrata]|uniref:Cardioacceleratory peptide receptor-like n=4 Tax=Biomphalaria TaxID=6525 RepID=A0A9W2Z4Y7_BIOGL|nr:cardioacceleratory peptide receptor-like [Biomphalaria glabrata]